jgi:hypothetical protein
MKMTFETALVHLKQGKRIRRAYWPEDVFIGKGRMPYDDEDTVLDMWINENGVVESIGYPDNESWFCPSDLLEDDWEVME